MGPAPATPADPDDQVPVAVAIDIESSRFNLVLGEIDLITEMPLAGYRLHDALRDRFPADGTAVDLNEGNLPGAFGRPRKSR